MRHLPPIKDAFDCPKFWEDVKGLKKQAPKLFSAREEVPDNASAEQRLRSTPITGAIFNVVIDPENVQSTLCDKQPFVGKGWKLYKLRFRFANRSASDGLRIVYAVNGSSVVFLYIYSKKPSMQEKEREAEIHYRLGLFLT